MLTCHSGITTGSYRLTVWRRLAFNEAVGFSTVQLVDSTLIEKRHPSKSHSCNACDRLKSPAKSMTEWLSDKKARLAESSLQR
jgi:hypothetical protein